MNGVLVIGAGPAALRLAERLVRLGHPGPIRLLGADPGPVPNPRMLLAILAGTSASVPPAASVGADHPGALLPDPPRGVVVERNTTVVDVDRRRRRVRTADGAEHHYDVLVLATGAEPELPGVPGLTTDIGSAAPGVRVLHPSYTATVPARPHAGGHVVLGGGVFGVRAALAARRAGHDVTWVHRGPAPLYPRLDPAGSELVGRAMRRAGVEVRSGRRAVAYRPGVLALDDGERIDTGCVLVCPAGRPRVGPARRAGLEVRGGVLVDDRLRTGDPRIHAIGDCAVPPGEPSDGGVGALFDGFDAQFGGGVSIAHDQAECLADVLTGGERRYRGAPAVLRLSVGGLDVAAIGDPDADGETVTVSDPAGGRHARVVRSGERLLGASLVGMPRAAAVLAQVHDGCRSLPRDLTGLLLDVPPDAWTGGEPGPDDVICACNGVTRRNLLQACRAGHVDLPAVARATGATTGCGGCAGEVGHLLADADRAAVPA